MFYNSQPSPINNWPSNVQYSSYQPDRRLKTIWFLALAIVLLTLTIAALIIVFSVEHSWFSDSFNNQTNNNLNYYGLWRLCFYANKTCDSWFSTSGPYSNFIYARLNQARVGINAWQAIEIVFLFLTTSTLIIAVTSSIFYRLKRGIYYYLALLATFCAWPAAFVGIAGLFVFGFSVFNVSPTPHYLGWCFYLNIAAVVLAIISAILLTIYNILLKRPMKPDRDEAIMETYTDITGYPTILSPSTFVVVRQDKKKKKKAYDYPQILYPNQYFPTQTVNNVSNTDFITNPNYQMLASYNQQTNSSIQQQQQILNPYRSSGLLTSPSTTSIAPQTRYYQPPIKSHRYQPPHWHRTESNPINYNNESVNDYVQRGIYRPTRLNPIEPKLEEPRVLHYYTGYDHFSAIDPSDVVLTRHHPSLFAGRTSPVRHTVNPSYYQQNDYLKSAM